MRAELPLGLSAPQPKQRRELLLARKNPRLRLRKVNPCLLVEGLLVCEVQVRDVPGRVLARGEVCGHRIGLRHGPTELEHLLRPLERVERLLHARRELEHRSSDFELRRFEGCGRDALSKWNLEDAQELLYHP